MNGHQAIDGSILHPLTTLGAQPDSHWFPHFHSDFFEKWMSILYLSSSSAAVAFFSRGCRKRLSWEVQGINFNYTCQCQGYRVASGKSDWFTINREGVRWGGLAVMEVSVATSSGPFITWEAAGIKEAVRDFDLEWELQHTHTCWHNTQFHTIPQLA